MASVQFEKANEINETRCGSFTINSLTDDVEPFQKRMSVSVTEMPPLATINGGASASNSAATLNKLATQGSSSPLSSSGVRTTSLL